MSNPRTLARQVPPAGDSETPLNVRWRVALIALILSLFFLAPAITAQTLTLQKNTSGIAINSAGGSAYTASFGTMNGLGIGTPATNVTAIPLANGTLYRTFIDMTPSGFNGHHSINVTAILTSIGKPAAFTPETCPSTSGCNASGNYATLTTTSSNAIATAIADSQRITSGLAIYVPDNNGATWFVGTDTIVITYTARDTSNNKSGSATLTLSVQNQTAVSLTLGTATGGLSIATASDYSMDFGTVNGLGIGAKAGLTTSAIAGGAIYSTPYYINPSFAGFLSTTATVQAAVTTNFQYPTVINLRDASVQAGPYTTLTSTPLQITGAAADRSQITRYLGLFVSSANGASGVPAGSYSATLTFTLTVP